MARAIARVPILGSLLSVEGNEVEVGGDLPVSGHEENGVWHHTRPQEASGFFGYISDHV